MLLAGALIFCATVIGGVYADEIPYVNDAPPNNPRYADPITNPTYPSNPYDVTDPPTDSTTQAPIYVPIQVQDPTQPTVADTTASQEPGSTPAEEGTTAVTPTAYVGSTQRYIPPAVEYTYTGPLVEGSTEEESSSEEDSTEEISTEETSAFSFTFAEISSEEEETGHKKASVGKIVVISVIVLAVLGAGACLFILSKKQ